MCKFVIAFHFNVKLYKYTWHKEQTMHKMQHNVTMISLRKLWPFQIVPFLSYQKTLPSSVNNELN